MVGRGMGTMSEAETFEQRDGERLLFHYRIERELADRLRHSSRSERMGGLYSEVYDELFRRVSDHPQHRKSSHSARTGQVGRSIATLEPWIARDGVFLEIGAGDAALSLEMAGRMRRVIALDVAELANQSAIEAPGFEFVLSNGVDLPFEDASIDLVYSNQLMEHLHPDDAQEQLESIHRILRPGGRYVFATPNRLDGPHDISGRWCATATGFHLREYTYGELARLLRQAGFSRLTAIVVVSGRIFHLPVPLMRLAEWAASIGGKTFSRSRIMQCLLRIQIAAQKA